MIWIEILSWAGNALVILAWALVAFGREVPGLLVALAGQGAWFVVAWHIGQPAIMFLMVTLCVLQVSGLVWRRWVKVRINA